jgi:hypothetical protein
METEEYVRLTEAQGALTFEQTAKIHEIAFTDAKISLQELESAVDDYSKFCALPSAVSAAFTLEHFELARALATESLASALKYPSDWNHGNALHLGHTVLGLLALRERDSVEAVRRLKLSAEHKGSPQLNSFGPTMHLARVLLVEGETQAVLQYFDQCRSFWSTGKPWLDFWYAHVTDGKVPAFFKNGHF